MYCPDTLGFTRRINAETNKSSCLQFGPKPFESFHGNNKATDFPVVH